MRKVDFDFQSRGFDLDSFAKQPKFIITFVNGNDFAGLNNENYNISGVSKVEHNLVFTYTKGDQEETFEVSVEVFTDNLQKLDKFYRYEKEGEGIKIQMPYSDYYDKVNVLF